MLNHRVHTGIKVMVGFVAMFAYAEANEGDQYGMTPTTIEDPMVEVVVVQFGPDEVIECTWNHPGYAFIEPGDMELAEAEANLLATESGPLMPEKEPLGFELYLLEEGNPSKLIYEFQINEEIFNMYGTAKASFPPPDPPPEQIIPFNNANGDPMSLLLVHPYNSGSDSDIETFCTIFGLEDIIGISGYEVDAAGRVAKKKVVKRKVTAKKKVVKRKVAKKAAKRKVAKKRPF